MLDQGITTLNPGVFDFADLFRVELLPAFVVELLVESPNESGVDKVDERIADVTVVLKAKPLRSVPLREL